MSKRKCSNCGQPGHRRDGCPKAPAEAKDGKAPKTPRELVAVLVSAAEQLGREQALASVEKATAEVLERCKSVRLELIRSRALNKKLRREMGRHSDADARTEAAALARLDKEEAQRERAKNLGHL